ncbi:threonine-phosphate decarboxylase CobD [Oryzifoliimicrobium ureilyticus]|uniref:threonine-phosphate decarboxylase CobD n=1 Tax=Oryzifoliimicrobium ureilyticus TaxID=3113724 RepID=UPI00307603D0
MTGRIIHGGGIAAAAGLYGGEPADWLDLSTGLNPNPPKLPEIPPSVWHRLPDDDLVMKAREAARDYYRSGPILPLPAPGTQSLIQLLPSLMSDVNRPVAIVSPTYGEYARVFRHAGLHVHSASTLEDVTDDCALAVVVNPNNPDGRGDGTESLVRLYNRLSATNGVLVVDEAFADTDPDISLAALAADMPRLLIFRSIGKFFGLAGARIGFAIASAECLLRLERGLGPWAVSGPALYLAEKLLSQDPIPLRNQIEGRKSAQLKVLERARLSVIGGTSLFSLVLDERAEEIHRHLCRHQILVRKFDYEPNWLRFGLAPDEAGDERLFRALTEFA